MSLHTALVKMEEEKISSEKAKKFIASEKNGAESVFIGKVRNENGGKKVVAVTYDANDQAVFFLIGAVLATITTLSVSSLVNKKLFDTNHNLPGELHSLKNSTYYNLIKNVLRNNYKNR